MEPDVFISHSSIDRPAADNLCAFLEKKGLRCWMAPRDILPGEEWGDSILRGIHACRIMVLIFSKAANDSGPVRSEVDRAVNARKVLIPFRIENVGPTGAMEFHIGRRHWLDAYTPPMQRHFELLVRAIRDVLKQPAGAANDIPSVDGTLPVSATLVRSTETVLPPVAGQEDVPLRLLLNFNHVVITGYPSTFQMIVENKSSEALERVEIVLESRGMEQAARKTFGKLLPAQGQRHLFEIEPIRSGNFVLQATIKCQQEGKQLAFLGSRSLRVNEAPQTSDLQSGIKNLQGNSDKPETPEANVPIQLVAPGSIRTLNDLLNLELPEDFEPLDLTLDYEVSMGALAQEESSAHHRLQIPAAFVARAQVGTLLKLEPVDPPGATTSMPEIKLVARANFSLGRSREEADFLLWFWPRGEANDAKTRRISKKHCLLAVRGSKLFVSSVGAANRTTFDGQEVTDAEGEPLEHRGILALAGIYFLDATPFPSDAPDGPAIANIKKWSGPSEAEAPVVRGSVRFLPMTPRVLPQNSTWFFTDGTFGTSRSNPVIVDVKGLAEIQGRFHYHLNAFWMESTINNGAVHLDGTKLEPGFILPLLSGQVLKLGAKSFRVVVA